MKKKLILPPIFLYLNTGKILKEIETILDMFKNEIYVFFRFFVWIFWNFLKRRVRKKNILTKIFENFFLEKKCFYRNSTDLRGKRFRIFFLWNFTCKFFPNFLKHCFLFDTKIFLSFHNNKNLFLCFFQFLKIYIYILKRKKI